MVAHSLPRRNPRRAFFGQWFVVSGLSSALRPPPSAFCRLSSIGDRPLCLGDHTRPRVSRTEPSPSARACGVATTPEATMRTSHPPTPRRDALRKSPSPPSSTSRIPTIASPRHCPTLHVNLTHDPDAPPWGPHAPPRVADGALAVRTARVESPPLQKQRCTPTRPEAPAPQKTHSLQLTKLAPTVPLRKPSPVRPATAP